MRDVNDTQTTEVPGIPDPFTGTTDEAARARLKRADYSAQSAVRCRTCQHATHDATRYARAIIRCGLHEARVSGDGWCVYWLVPDREPG